MRPALVLLVAAVALPAAAQTPNRYGFAPAEAQTPMHPAAPALRAESKAPASHAPIVAAPSLRMLSWPGKSARAATTVQAVSAPVAPRVVHAAPVVRASAPAPAAPAAPTRAVATAWTPRARWTRSAPRPSAPVVTPVLVPAATEGVAPASRPTFVAPPGVIAGAPAAPPAPVVARAAPQGVAAMGPPQNPWYNRWPEASAAPDPTVGAGVGASLAPGAPAPPPPGSALSGYAPPSAATAPVRTAMAGPATRSTAKYYSVHTAYGHAPDPAPIPPQFFGPTADLSTPETPEPARATLTANAASAKAAVNAARLQQEAAQ